MARRYLVDPLPEPGPVRLPEGTAHHLGSVMRVRTGEVVTLFDGRGHECEARVLAARGRRIDVEARPARPVVRERARRVELAVALPKGARADWLFEHATELGVAAMRPIQAARSDDARAKLERWRRIVRAAAGQCDRSHLPAVHPPASLAELLACRDLPRQRYLAMADAPALHAEGAGAAVLLVGPPGGWTDAEVGAAREAGFVPRGLGPLTLRTETAALAGAAILLQGS